MTDALLSESRRLLDPIDRISEVLFGLIMAATIIGSMSVAGAGHRGGTHGVGGGPGLQPGRGRSMRHCILMRMLTERSRLGVLARQVRGADAATAQRLIAAALPPHVAAITGADEIDGMRRRLAAAPELPTYGLKCDDYLAALGVFLLVVAATFPVVLPFLLAQDAAVAMKLSRGVTLAMLFAQATHSAAMPCMHARC